MTYLRSMKPRQLSIAISLTLLAAFFATGVCRRAADPNLRKRVLIKSDGIPKEGFGSTLAHFVDAASIASALNASLRFTKTPQMFDYRVRTLLQSDTLELRRAQKLCKLHSIVLKDPSRGMMFERVERAFNETDAFIEQINECCLQAKPHVIPDYIHD